MDIQICCLEHWSFQTSFFTLHDLRSSKRRAPRMDWQGQKLAEQLMQLMLLAFAVTAFTTGYVLGSFQTMMLTYAGGVVLTTLVTVPNWPFYNRHHLKWSDPSQAEKHPKPLVQPISSSSKKKSSKK